MHCMRHILTLLLACLPSCSKPVPEAPRDPLLKDVVFTQADTQEADELYASLCTSCHGTSGRGDGSDSKTLDSPPRSFADKNWQAEADDEQIAQTIIFGGDATGLSDEMQAFPDLCRDRPVLAALVAKIRSFHH